jgi:quercetin dioxygenase-like cupin family protein
MKIREVVSPRRIVTGLNERGESCIARVEKVEIARTGWVVPQPLPGALLPYTMPEPEDFEHRGGYYRMWASDHLPLPLPREGRAPVLDIDVTPEETPDILRIAGACPPPLGMRAAWARYGNKGGPGPMHWHDSIDIRFVMAGVRGQVADSGEEFVWQTGDVMIQNGTNHSHYQFDDESCIMGFVVLGALRVGKFPPVDELHPVQRGPVGGHRLGETRGKQPMPPWSAPKPKESDSKLKLLPEMIKSYEDVVRPRRVVTGMNSDGKTYLARVEEIEEIDYEYALRGPKGEQIGAIYPVWGADRLPELLPTDGKAPAFDTHPSADEALDALHRSHLLPPPLGYRVSVVKMVPTAERTAMRWHDSYDVIYVMHGEVTIYHDDGSELQLEVGDTLIQNGTNHAWRNRGNVDAWLGVVSLGAARFGPTPPESDLSPLQRGSANRTGERA